jgi:hypothetical protein
MVLEVVNMQRIQSIQHCSVSGKCNTAHSSNKHTKAPATKSNFSCHQWFRVALSRPARSVSPYAPRSIHHPSARWRCIVLQPLYHRACLRQGPQNTRPGGSNGSR